jgi:anti-sigma regulatory factor (Ser/Thr protein kinase)
MKNLSGELENAFNKELQLIKNDLYYQQVEIPKKSGHKLIRFDIFYKPLETLSGDSYSVRKTKDDKIVFFLIDAMGKGISASVTATSTTTLLNYIFDQMERTKDFEFERWIKRYVEHIKTDLLDNEMLSIFFACYDRKSAVLTYASFGMPSFLAVSEKGEFTKMKSNNMPINKYSDESVVDTLSVKYVKKALFYTDGLCESIMSDGKFYKDKMYQDFNDSHSIVDFISRVKENVPIEDDDISFFYIDTITYDKELTVKKVAAKREGLDEVLYEISECAKKEGAKPKELSELSLALSELLTNALEHGLFGISNRQKNMLIEKGLFDETISELEKKYPDKNIIVKYGIKHEGSSKIFVVRIEDGGEGFDVKILKHLVVNSQSFNGRGIMIVKKLVDRFYFNEKGNTITIRKYLN